MTLDLFADLPAEPLSDEVLQEGAVVLRGFASGDAQGLLGDIERIASQSPWRHMITPGGFRMSVAMTGAGPYGWTSSSRGYRYAQIDPETGAPWPGMPPLMLDLARRAAAAAGFANFDPDACLVNRYEPGARMSLHQDRDEENRDAPIVSVSLGLPATFMWGGMQRSDRPRKVPLAHGDVVVWGGPARFVFHGVSPLKDGEHPLVGKQRLNITFRRVKRG